MKQHTALMLLLLLFFSSFARSNESAECYSDLDNYPGCYPFICTGTKDAKSILEGPVYQMGNFEDCVYNATQQYCLANIHIYPGDRPSELWFRIKNMTALRTLFRRDLLFVGVCVPNSLNAEEVENKIFDMLTPAATALGVRTTVSIEPLSCQSRYEVPLTTGDVIFGTVILAISTLVISGTIYDSGPIKKEQNEDKSSVEELLLCFSTKRNWKRLLMSDNSRTLSFIEGIRSILAFIIILIHLLFFLALVATTNLEWIEDVCMFSLIVLHGKFKKLYRSRVTTIVIHTEIWMMAYFCIGGFLLGYNTKRRMENGKFTYVHYMKAVGRRYLMYTPSIMLLIAFVATWMNHAGSGPFWQLLFEREMKNCRHHWWSNLFYLNNYVYAEKPCNGHLWYIAADFQNYLISLFILMLMNKYQKKKWHIASFVMFVWIIIPFIQTYREELDPALLLLPEMLRHVSKNKTFLKAYIRFEFNAAPYFVGVIFGYVFFTLKASGCKLSKKTAVALWTAIMIMFVCIFSSVSELYQPDYKYNVLAASLYASLHKLIFAIGVGSVLLLCSLGYGGAVLSGKAFQIIGSLTFGIYLTHFAIVFIYYIGSKEPITVSYYYVITEAVFYYALSLGLSLVLLLCVQMPIRNLSVLKLWSGSKSSKSL